MAKYIFGEKNGIYIIDLQKTVESIQEACSFLQEVITQGETVLFVGTKRQAQHIMKEQAQKSEMFYVVERWLGGTLTNFKTIRQSINRLNELEALKTSPTYELLSKKERAQISKELDKLVKNLEGIRKMNRLPAAIFVIDSKKEEIAINEANKLSIPVVALIDTNSDPDKVDYVIPGNDDAIKSVELIAQIVGEGIREGRQAVAISAAKSAEAQAKGASLKADEAEIERLVGEEVKDDKAKDERIKRKTRRQRRPTR
jgi:small subunit ribosomal protein S2